MTEVVVVVATGAVVVVVATGADVVVATGAVVVVVATGAAAPVTLRFVVVVVTGLDVVVVATGAVVVVGATVVTVVDVVVDVDVVAVVAAQVGIVTTLSSSVTAPLRAITRPLTLAPVFRVMDVSARIDPAKLLVVPRVAELPTCQNTWHACAPFSNTTLLDVAAISDEPA
jgi:hypothetical protein